MPIPLWSAALVIAALAPYAARLLERALVERRRARTLAILREAGLDGVRELEGTRATRERVARREEEPGPGP